MNNPMFSQIGKKNFIRGIFKAFNYTSHSKLENLQFCHLSSCIEFSRFLFKSDIESIICNFCNFLSNSTLPYPHELFKIITPEVFSKIIDDANLHPERMRDTLSFVFYLSCDDFPSSDFPFFKLSFIEWMIQQLSTSDLTNNLILQIFHNIFMNDNYSPFLCDFFITRKNLIPKLISYPILLEDFARSSNILENESYFSSFIPMLIQKIQQSDDKCSDYLRCLAVLLTTSSCTQVAIDNGLASIIFEKLKCFMLNDLYSLIFCLTSICMIEIPNEIYGYEFLQRISIFLPSTDIFTLKQLLWLFEFIPIPNLIHEGIITQMIFLLHNGSFQKKKKCEYFLCSKLKQLIVFSQTDPGFHGIDDIIIFSLDLLTSFKSHSKVFNIISLLIECLNLFPQEILKCFEIAEAVDSLQDVYDQFKGSPTSELALQCLELIHLQCEVLLKNQNH